MKLNARPPLNRPLVAVSSGLLMLLICAAVFAPALTPFDPAQQDLLGRLQPPGWADRAGNVHITGTDHLGRDIFTRMLYASRVSLTVGFAAVLLGGGFGLLMGLASGYFGGWLDSLITRLGEMQLAFPFLLLAIVLVSVLGPSLVNVVLVLALATWVDYAKVVRSEVLQLREREFVRAARVLGYSDTRLILRHILPNVLSSFLVVASFQVAALIIAESSLSFLGLGVPNNIPTWGGILADGRAYVRTAWWLSVFPGLAIMVAALSFNLLGDGLRDAIDPTQRKRKLGQEKQAQPPSKPNDVNIQLGG